MSWKDWAVGAATAAQVSANTASGSTDTSQLADYTAAQNEARMEQYADSVRQTSSESTRSGEVRSK